MLLVVAVSLTNALVESALGVALLHGRAGELPICHKDKDRCICFGTASSN